MSMISLSKHETQGHTGNIQHSRPRQLADWGQSIKPPDPDHSLPSLYPSR
jgi:hypothetical protein